MKPCVVQHRTGVIAECKQHVIVEFFKAARTIRAHDDPLEVVADVDRNRNEAMDLPVGRRPAWCWLVLPDDFIPLEHALCEALGDVAVRGVIVEAPMCDQVEPAVVIPIAPAEQQPLLASHELDCDSQHELTDVVCVTERLLAPVHGEHLLAQLTGPLPFRLTRSFDTETRLLLMPKRLLLAAEPALQLVSLGLGVREVRRSNSLGPCSSASSPRAGAPAPTPPAIASSAATAKLNGRMSSSASKRSPPPTPSESMSTVEAAKAAVAA